LESPNFSKDFFGGFGPFQWVTGPKKFFSVISKFFAPAEISRETKNEANPFVFGQNETKTFRQRNHVFC
jgi:hypothetical protein